MINLPCETIQHICEYLDRPSILNFSSTSSNCRLALKALIFRTARITFDSPESLNINAELSLKLLRTSKSLQHVQCLYVVAKQLFTLSRSPEDCGDRSLDAWKYCCIDLSRTKPVTGEDEWSALYQLIRSLPALRKLTWGCSEQIPRCILRYIDENLLRCQVYLKNFCLNSLVQPSNSAVRIDPWDLEIATSRCLYGVTIRCDSLDTPGWVNYNKQAIMDMVAGASPNLQDVSMLLVAGYGGPPLDTPVLYRKQEQNSGIDILSSTDARLGALRNLEIMEQDSGRALRFWKTKTDYKVLQSLKVHYRLATPEINWLAENCQFSSLHTLAMNLKPLSEGEDSLNHLENGMESFISSLPPLGSVKLTGKYTNRIVDTVLRHCGRRLRQLLLGSPFDLVHGVFASLTLSRAMQEECPLLEELTLPLIRSGGDAHEIAIYRSFAQMPTIRKLRLSVFCSQPFLWDEDQQDQEADLDYQVALGERPGLADQICHTIAELAIDKTLATSIFHTIVSASGPNSSALECLELRVDALKSYHGFDSASDIIRLLQYVGRSWTCARKSRADQCHQYQVVECDQKEELRRREIDDVGMQDEEIGMNIAELFLRVWPQGPSKDWKTVWHSFPLNKPAST